VETSASDGSTCSFERAETIQLLLTDRCNLACSYCYEKSKIGRRMNEGLACELVARHLGDTNSSSGVLIDFCGGEPLLAFESIKKIVAFVHSREWPRAHGFEFSTNGTLLTPEVTTWLDSTPCVTFGLSLDGLPKAHDLNRSGSYRRAERAVPWMLERCRRTGQRASVKMTISPATIPMISEGVKHLHSLGFLEVAANVPFESLWSTSELPRQLDAFAGELERLLQFYLSHEGLGPPQLVSLPIEKLAAARISSLPRPRWCGAGKMMTAYDVDGRRYPCHRFLPSTTGTRTYSGPYALSDLSEPTAPSICDKCPIAVACPTCLGNNWEESGDPFARTTHHCAFVLLQMKASAKYKALSAARKLARNSVKDASSINQARAELDVAEAVLDMFDSLVNGSTIEESVTTFDGAS
jgi:uncharacterized protein